MANAETLTLTDEQHAELASAVEKLGFNVVMQRTGLSRESLTRLLARLPVRKGTLFMAATAIPQLAHAA